MAESREECMCRCVLLPTAPLEATVAVCGDTTATVASDLWAPTDFDLRADEICSAGAEGGGPIFSTRHLLLVFPEKNGPIR